jgi:hypothetical protein
VRALTVAVYAALTVALIGLELAARIAPRAGIPTLAAVLRHPMRLRATRIGLLMAWWWFGWHFFVG